MQIIYVHGAAASEQSFNWFKMRLPKHKAKFLNYPVHEPIASVVARLIAAIDEPSILLGHSLGGIITATCVDHPEVEKLITLCTPFGGLQHAEIISMFTFEPMFRDLRCHSPLLTSLRAKKITKPHLAIAGTSGLPIFGEPNDGVLTVASQTMLPTKYEMLPLNHFEVLLSAKVIELITDFIRD